MEDLQKAMQANPEMAKQMEAMQVGVGVLVASSKACTSRPALTLQPTRLQEAMKRPEVQEQLAQMQAMQNNKNLQARLQELKGDPEFAGGGGCAHSTPVALAPTSIKQPPPQFLNV